MDNGTTVSSEEEDKVNADESMNQVVPTVVQFAFFYGQWCHLG